VFSSGHYDILYKAEDISLPEAPPQATLQIGLAGDYGRYALSPNMPEVSPFPEVSGVVDIMNAIPGLYSDNIGQTWPSNECDVSSSLQEHPQVVPAPPYAPLPTPVTPVATSRQEYAARVHSSHISHQPHTGHHPIQIESSIGHAMHVPPPVTIERGGPFRPSVYELEPGFHSGQGHSLPFQTSIFRK